ncbi:MAG: flavodoxin family protein [Desulfobacteraceae bacterium]|nr:flavodoxin family protein [Desulfobacteraceae bacterium]
MKIITLMGSSKKKGNTATILGWVEERLRAKGHEVESIYLHSQEINPCLGCAKCKENPTQVACIRKDDGLGILEKMARADLTLFASPLYFWGLTSQTKAIMDRSYSLVTNYHKPDHASLVEGRRQALLVTGGSDFTNNAEPAFTAFERLVNFYKGKSAGELYVKCTVPEALDLDVKKQAIGFADKIAG